MARIGVYAGTFDPIHSGHTEFALAAAEACALDAVMLAPEPKPRSKQYVTDIAYRMDMAQLASEQHDKLDVLKLPFEQFTVQYTLPMIQSMFPEAELTLLVGSDVAITFSERWEHLDRLFEAMALAVGVRPGHSAEEVQKLLNRLGLPVRVTFIKGNHAASRAIRAGSMTDIDILLDPKVAAYAAAHNLY